MWFKPAKTSHQWQVLVAIHSTICSVCSRIFLPFSLLLCFPPYRTAHTYIISRACVPPLFDIFKVVASCNPVSVPAKWCLIINYYQRKPLHAGSSPQVDKHIFIRKHDASAGVFTLNILNNIEDIVGWLASATSVRARYAGPPLAMTSISQNDGFFRPKDQGSCSVVMSQQGLRSSTPLQIQDISSIAKWSRQTVRHWDLGT